MRQIAVIDAETDPFKKNRIPRPFLWGYYNGSEYHQFTDTQKLAEFIADREEIIYAHNGGKFDFHFLLEYLEPFDNIMLINGRITKMRIGSAELRDSYSIIPAPLSAYQKDEIDYALFEAGIRDKPENFRKIAKYLQSDCVYLWQLVTRFVEEYGLQITQASSAMKQWQKIAPLDVPKTTAEFYADMSVFYYGGRVQCFRHGVINERFAVYDINSAYPRAMMEKHPYSENYATDDGYSPTADFYIVIADAVGAFPYRDADGLTFPDDGIPREFYVTRWEYEAARDTGALINATVLRSVTFCGHMDFSEYIGKFWALRKEAKEKKDDAGSLLYKLAMNSLYGKFAANPESYREYMVFPQSYAADVAVSGWALGGELGPWVLGQAPLSAERMRYYNVATGASITGYVRAMLWRAICASNGGVIYCDTDSIATTASDPGIALGDALGEWKHEGDFDRAGIGGKKLYIFRGVEKNGKREYKTASKGVRLNNADLWKVAKGCEVSFTPENPTFSPKKPPTFTTRKIKPTY